LNIYLMEASFTLTMPDKSGAFFKVLKELF